MNRAFRGLLKKVEEAAAQPTANYEGTSPFDANRTYVSDLIHTATCEERPVGLSREQADIIATHMTNIEQLHRELAEERKSYGPTQRIRHVVPLGTYLRRVHNYRKQALNSLAQLNL